MICNHKAKPFAAYSFLFQGFIYKPFTCKRVLNKRTNLGNMYLENKYIVVTSNKKLKVTWLTKKKGTNCGILIFNITMLSFIHRSLNKKFFKQYKAIISKFIALCNV